MSNKNDNSLVPKVPKVIKIGDDLVQVDGRNRPIRKVTLDEVTKLVDTAQSDLDSMVKDFVKKEDLSSYVKASDLSKLTAPDLSSYMKRDEANSRFALQKGLIIYATHPEVDEKIRSQHFSHLVKKSEAVSFVLRDELNSFVSKDYLATIVSPGSLAKLASKDELSSYCKKTDLESLAQKSECLPKSILKSDLDLGGSLKVKGIPVKLSGEKEQCSTRHINSAPAKLTSSDKYVIIMNSTSNLFGVIVHKGKAGDELVIKDGTGSAHHSAIKIVSSNEETFDGKLELFISEAYGCKRLIHNGKEWNIV